MTNDIFPEDALISNDKGTYLEIKNRKLDILKEEQTYITLLDKGDLVRIEAPTKLLVDGVVIYIKPEEGN